MPAIQVARTDTFERQRQKINEIGDQLFTITQGGSDLATGNLKLGDGTQSLPSLSFVNDSSLGLFKSGIKTLGFVSGTKKIYEYDSQGVSIFSYLDFKKKSLITSGLAISSAGQNYDPGTYLDITATGGSGIAASLDLVVTAHTGVFNSYSKDYVSGSFQNVILLGGSGTGATVNFSVSALAGSITNNGTLYTQGIYPGVSLTGGNGSGAIADIAVGAVGNIFNVDITDPGIGYQAGDVLSVNAADVGGTGSGFQFTIDTENGVIQNLQWTDKGLNYQVGDVLSLPGQITGISAELKGSVTGVAVTLSTASPTVSVASTAGIVAGMFITVEDGSTGTMFPGTEVQSVDSVNNTITFNQNPTGDGAASLTITSQGTLEETTIATGLAISEGYIVTVSSGSGQLAANTTVLSYDSGSGLLTLNQSPSLAGSATLTITPGFGYNSNTPWTYTIDAVGVVESIDVNNPGFGYIQDDVISVSSFDLVQPITLTVTVSAVTEIVFQGTISSGTILDTDTFTFDPGGLPQPIEIPIIKVVESGGNITSVFVGDNTFSNGDVLTLQRTSATYTVDSTINSNKYFIDGEITPNLTLYSGNTYIFDYTSASSHPFAFSRFPDGPNAPSVKTLSTSLSTTSKTITVASTVGISSGMSVSSGGNDAGQVASNTFVDTVDDATTLTLTEFPTSSGSSLLTFAGIPYTDGVTIGSDVKTIKVSDTTPNLYYYCEVHPNMGGEDGQEGLLTIDTNNPKVFGSGLAINVNQIEETDIIKFDIVEGRSTLTDLVSTTATIGDLTVSNTASVSELTASTSVTTPAVSTNNQLNLFGTSVKSNADFLVGSNLTIAFSDGDITTSGTIRSTLGFVSNNQLVIENNKVKTLAGYNLILEPYSANCVEIISSTSLNIPVGTTLERPGQGLRASGSIRFNTTTNQYEGYSGISNAWSSLGGVRDVDGNTYILAELTPGSNDNTLWFYNDSINTVRFTRQYLEFINMKRVRSLNTSAPDYVDWTSNTPVVAGQYLKWKSNIYEVISDGSTDTSGNEPSDITGNPFVNGSATLQYYTTAVSTLTFEEISQINIGPTESVPMVFQNDLRITKNTISTDLTDITLKPNTGRRIICLSKTHLQIPAGTESEKSSGTAKNGSIRYNTTNQVYEGFSETTQTWGSLGGVKDVDQNTYIIPELGPGTNENILYFFNDNINTVQLTTTALDFTNINVVTCSFDDSLEITAGTVTFDNSATTIDNTVANTTFIHTSRDRLDFGLSTGLVVDPLLRLDDQGDIYYNTGFGTGSESLVRIFDKELANLEISKYRITSSNASLLKGTTNNSAAVIYSPSTELSAKIELIAHNTTTGEKEIIEFSVIDNGSDIFYTEVGTIQSNGSIIDYTFDFNVNNAVRLNYSLATGVANANAVNVTVVSNVIKK